MDSAGIVRMIWEQTAPIVGRGNGLRLMEGGNRVELQIHRSKSGFYPKSTQKPGSQAHKAVRQ